MSRPGVFIVASPRPRVGRTLLARLLADFFFHDAREVAAFDLDPDRVLGQFIPAHTTPVDLSGITGQMALFDRLVEEDGVAKIVDVSPGAFADFFKVAREIGFAAEAWRRGIVPVTLFVVDAEGVSADAYAQLRARLRDMVVVPVYNEFLGRNLHREKFPPGPASVVHVPMLAPGLRKYIDRRPFSFADPKAMKPLDIPLDVHIELQRWLRRIFVEFRELELRVLLTDLRVSLQSQ